MFCRMCATSSADRPGRSFAKKVDNQVKTVRTISSNALPNAELFTFRTNLFQPLEFVKRNDGSW